MCCADDSSYCIWSGELQTFSESDSNGFISTSKVAVLRRIIDSSSDDIEVQDELRIYDSRWQGNYSQCISINKETTCCRMMLAPDRSSLPASDCIMKIRSKDASVMFSVTLDFLQKLQHT
jgi:hypothetical protein